MWKRLREAGLENDVYDGVIWYSPSIFFEPLIRRLKARSACKSYLILRDIFPEWAIDMGLIKEGPVSRFFSAVARRQYRIADVIGVQTPGNLHYFSDRLAAAPESLEVLQNWIEDLPEVPCSIDLSLSKLSGRTQIV